MPSTAAHPDANMAPSRHRTLWRVLAGVGVGFLISAVAAFVAAFALYDLGAFGAGPGYSSAVVTVVVVGGSVVVSAVLAALVARAAVEQGASAVVGGVMLGAVLVLVTLAVWGAQRDFDPSEMAQSSIDSRLAGLTNAHREAFYFGDEVEGMHLASIHEPGETLYFNYGRCLDPEAEGECIRPLVVSVRATKLFKDNGSTAQSCKRIAPILGVPAAREYNSALVFTGSSIVTVEYYRANSAGFVPDLRRSTTFAAQLRPVGSSSAAGSLPPPDSRTQRFVDKHCGRKVS